MQIQITEHIKKLEAFGTRYFDTDGNRGAQAYIESCLKNYGYEVQQSLCQYRDESYISPWCTTPNVEGPTYLLAAHFDTISQDKEGNLLDSAPGADDNATGVAILLETARALAGKDLPHNLGFVFFNVEEPGKFGSKYFALDWRQKGKVLDGVINIDTIGTWPVSLAQGGKVNYVSNKMSAKWLDQVTKSLKLDIKEAATPWQDDQASFWEQGYPAIEFTEEDCTPVMHTPSDTSDKIDFPSVTGVAEAVTEMFSKPLRQA